MITDYDTYLENLQQSTMALTLHETYYDVPIMRTDKGSYYAEVYCYKLNTFRYILESSIENMKISLNEILVYNFYYYPDLIEQE